MNPHDMSTRIDAVRRYLAKEGTYEEVAAQVGVGSASLKRWVARSRAGESLVPKAKGGSKPKLTPLALESIRALVLDEPNWTTSELADEVFDEFGIRVSRQVVGRALRSMGITFKRGSIDRHVPRDPKI